jgi:predicted dehydrogenase
LGALQATTASWPGMPARVELYGESGSIVLIDGRIAAWRLKDADEGEEEAMCALDAGGGSGSADPMAIGIDKHVAQVRDFIEAVRGEHPPMVPGTEARRAVEIVLAVYASARTGAAVDLPLARG